MPSSQSTLSLLKSDRPEFYGSAIFKHKMGNTEMRLACNCPQFCGLLMSNPKYTLNFKPHFLHPTFMFQPKIFHKLVIRQGVIVILSGVLVGSLSSCANNKTFTPEMTLQVTPDGASGIYIVNGQTNLPQPEVEKRKLPIVITVQAIRQLTPKAGSKTLTNTQPLHAVIARQRIETTDGKWTAKLNLLNANAKGGAVEVWQLNSGDLPADLEPAANVTFLAATDSIDRTLNFSPDVNKTTPDGLKPVLQSAKDGSLFLQSELSQTIAPPTMPKMAATAPGAIVKVQAQPISVKSSPKQNSAPVLPKEMMR